MPGKDSNRSNRAIVNVDNRASIALAESVGMQKECIRRGFLYENEQWVNQLIYVALPHDMNLVEKPPATRLN